MKYPRAVTAIVTFCILLLTTGYCSAYLGSFSADGLHNALGATGGLLIGISLGLGPLSGRIAAARRLLRLRKAFGLTGYGFAVLYTGIAVARHPSDYFGDFPDRLLYMDNLLGSIALALLTLMTALSNRPAVRLLGYGSWKRIMRCGYLAFALLAVRAWLMEKGLWLDWLNDPISLAPPRLILAVFALVVISTRLLSVKPSSTKLAGEPLLKRQV